MSVGLAAGLAFTLLLLPCFNWDAYTFSVFCSDGFVADWTFYYLVGEVAAFLFGDDIYKISFN